MASSLYAASSNPFLAKSSRTREGFGVGGLSKLLSPNIHISIRRGTSLPTPTRKHCLEVIKASGNTFGTHFRVTTYGESHGGGVGCIIDGCPPRLPLSEIDMQPELDRRRPGQNLTTSPRKETDMCRIYSGVADGLLQKHFEVRWSKLRGTLCGNDICSKG